MQVLPKLSYSFSGKALQIPTRFVTNKCSFEISRKKKHISDSRDDWHRRAEQAVPPSTKVHYTTTAIKRCGDFRRSVDQQERMGGVSQMCPCDFRQRSRYNPTEEDSL